MKTSLEFGSLKLHSLNIKKCGQNIKARIYNIYDQNRIPWFFTILPISDKISWHVQILLELDRASYTVSLGTNKHLSWVVMEDFRSFFRTKFFCVPPAYQTKHFAFHIKSSDSCI